MASDLIQPGSDDGSILPDGRRYGVIVIPDWLPPSLNEFIGCTPFKIHRAKKDAAELLAVYAYGSTPKPRFITSGYRPIRKVLVTFTTPGTIDADNTLKVLLDAMKQAALIVDDSQKWCQWDRPEVVKGTPKRTFIGITDVGMGDPIAEKDDPAYKRLIAAAIRRGSKNV